MMFATLSSGHVDLADWLFLAAIILLALATLTQIPSVRPTGDPWYRFFVAAGLVCVAIGWFVL
jgi:cadmium resistance protein CadD (predicted permease)